LHLCSILAFYLPSKMVLSQDKFEELLPSEFGSVVHSFVPHETEGHFTAVVRARCTDISSVDAWRTSFCTRTGIQFNSLTSTPDMQKYVCKKTYACCHGSQKKTVTAAAAARKVRSKNTDCKSTIHMRVMMCLPQGNQFYRKKVQTPRSRQPYIHTYSRQPCMFASEHCLYNPLAGFACFTVLCLFAYSCLANYFVLHFRMRSAAVYFSAAGVRNVMLRPSPCHAIQTPALLQCCELK
jgi:hypothetical protein